MVSPINVKLLLGIIEIIPMYGQEYLSVPVNISGHMMVSKRIFVLLAWHAQVSLGINVLSLYLLPCL